MEHVGDDKQPRADDGEPLGAITDRNADGVAERVEYAEEEIVASMDIQVATATATSVGALPYSSIERWVSMVKALHLALYPDLVGKWLYVRGKFDHYQDVYEPAARHQVVVQANFNSKMTRTAVLVDGQKVGDIFFSLE
jgi:hypothetical protein